MKRQLLRSIPKIEMDRQYPIGKFIPKESYTPAELKENINRIAALPEELNSVVEKLSGEQVNKAYRPGGWTGRQVIHHLADSHMNAYIRIKWTLTEDTPLIKAYNEKAWAETNETFSDPMISVALIAALHKKWVLLLESLAPSDFQKSFLHPENGNQITIARMIALYAWHGEHHLAHLNLLVKS